MMDYEFAAGWSVEKDKTNRQTNKHPDRQAKFIYSNTQGQTKILNYLFMDVHQIFRSLRKYVT